MPLRTSAVVAGGLALLTVIGVASVFGDSILAVVSPPATEHTNATGRAPADGGVRAAPGQPVTTTPASSARPPDGGAGSGLDGSS